MQTPQGVNRIMMLDGITKLKKNNKTIYDDVMVFEEVYGIKPKIVMGRYDNIKVTTETDLNYVTFLLNGEKSLDMEKQMFRIGHSNDVHELVKSRKLILGGIEIPYEYGLLGHSDADVLLHAVTESIIGALGLCDIGTLFPDNDDKYLDMDSSYFVKEAYRLMDEKGYMINNIDTIIYFYLFSCIFTKIQSYPKGITRNCEQNYEKILDYRIHPDRNGQNSPESIFRPYE